MAGPARTERIGYEVSNQAYTHNQCMWQDPSVHDAQDSELVNWDKGEISGEVPAPVQQVRVVQAPFATKRAVVGEVAVESEPA